MMHNQISYEYSKIYDYIYIWISIALNVKHCEIPLGRRRLKGKSQYRSFYVAYWMPECVFCQKLPQ